MSEKEKKILQELVKITKSFSVRNQSYECAAQLRDIEKYLERSDCRSDSAEEFFIKIQDQFDKVGLRSDRELSEIERVFESTKNYIFKQIRRQDILNKLFGDVD